MTLEEMVKESSEQVKSKLVKIGFDIPFTTRIVEGDSFVGVYLKGSIRNGTAEMVISSTLAEQFLAKRPDANIPLEVTYTIAHEMIHSIQDLVAYLADEPVDYNEDDAEELGKKLIHNESILSSSLIKRLNSFA